MFDQEGRFVLQNYGTAPTFSSFLPGIAGPTGVPIWCYYNNRGQAVCSFGIADKDHPIAEFSPAHIAYQTVARTGFRTFCKYAGKVIEPFADGHGTMHIGSNALELRWQNDTLAVTVSYVTMPSDHLGALLRTVTLTNCAAVPCDLTVLDGLAALVPYGVAQDALKNMTETAKAWMQAEDAATGLGYYRVRASMQDTATVTQIAGGNFCCYRDETGALLPLLVRPDSVFGCDTAYRVPHEFVAHSLSEMLAQQKAPHNIFPCAFAGCERTLAPAQSITLYAAFGQAQTKAQFHAFAKRAATPAFFRQKQDEARALVQALCNSIETKTANPVFDAYCRQTYLDNVLRGGVPVFFSAEQDAVPFYLYSRKHGDPERDYNYFQMSAEPYAQGNGNYRDVNQNRRSDVRFCPRVGAHNIHLFFSLIQSDGYNPLVIGKTLYTLVDAAPVLSLLAPQSRAQAATFFAMPFTPGALVQQVQKWQLAVDVMPQDVVACALKGAESETTAVFGEGYWSDHWTYNLDLIESYLSIFPEQKQTLLHAEASYPWYATQALILPRAQRYVQTEKGLRQYHFLQKKQPKHTWMHTQQGEGVIAYSTLFEKIVLLCLVKFAALDAFGMGVEMEGGKPGWYDALNGLPGLLGSSVAESCELLRWVLFVQTALEEASAPVALFAEMAQLARDVQQILNTTTRGITRWHAINDAKETYRARTQEGVCGAKEMLEKPFCKTLFATMAQALQEGLQEAIARSGGICPTYFWYEAVDVQALERGLLPTSFVPHALPLFLEGPVHWLKLPHTQAQKANMIARVQQSNLYDEALQMYKVNESLNALSYEAGRCKTFTPGWLENESIWLHMEYKYLLELLKSQQYEHFAAAFAKAAVPFLNPEQYGRSTLENVSFIASSANPDAACHGRGFVARLSGSTAEFLELWQVMMFGAMPFSGARKETLTLQFRPFLPDYLIPENRQVSATFLGSIAVCYHLPDSNTISPQDTHVMEYHLMDEAGNKTIVKDAVLSQTYAHAVRAQDFTQIDVFLIRNKKG